jgi:hypothetical protein
MQPEESGDGHELVSIARLTPMAHKGSARRPERRIGWAVAGEGEERVMRESLAANHRLRGERESGGVMRLAPFSMGAKKSRAGREEPAKLCRGGGRLEIG